jgi:hypothetical protein
MFLAQSDIQLNHHGFPPAKNAVGGAMERAESKHE